MNIFISMSFCKDPLADKRSFFLSFLWLVQELSRCPE